MSILLIPKNLSKLAFLCICICGVNSGHCKKVANEALPNAPEESPWLTGPLLTPSAHSVPGGFINIEPYLFVTDTFGAYNSHWKSHSLANKNISGNVQLSLQIGLTERWDCQLTPQGFYTHVEHAGTAVRFGDLPAGVDFQILKDRPDRWYPAIKLALKELFPTGKFQRLNPHKDGADISGGGSYATTVGLVFGKLYHFKDVYFLNSRLAVGYTVPSAVRVHGFNAYGGGFGTNGKVYPGNIFNAIIGLEFTLSRNWAFALDILEVYGNRTRFSGKKGHTAPGIKAAVGGPSFNQLSLAPAIEYNFNEALGIIAGPWFSVAGRNTAEFVSGVFAVNWYGALIPAKKHKTAKKHWWQRFHHTHGGGGGSGGTGGPGGMGNGGMGNSGG